MIFNRNVGFLPATLTLHSVATHDIPSDLLKLSSRSKQMTAMGALDFFFDHDNKTGGCVWRLSTWNHITVSNDSEPNVKILKLCSLSTRNHIKKMVKYHSGNLRRSEGHDGMLVTGHFLLQHTGNWCIGIEHWCRLNIDRSCTRGTSSLRSWRTI